MAIAARVGCKIPKNTNLTHPEIPHLILGPFSTASANTTIYTCMVVSIASGGAATVTANKVKPQGIVINQPDINWGTTVPGNYVLLPSLIDFYICSFGPCLVAMDVSEVTDAAIPIASPVYVAKSTSGLCDPELVSTTGEATDYCIGGTLDENAGFTTLAAGADGDLVEVFINIALAPILLSTA